MGERNVLAFENLPLVKINEAPALIYHLSSLFQTGFLFQCQIGLSIEDFLLRQPALRVETVKKRISTMSLDG